MLDSFFTRQRQTPTFNLKSFSKLTRIRLGKIKFPNWKKSYFISREESVYEREFLSFKFTLIYNIIKKYILSLPFLSLKVLFCNMNMKNPLHIYFMKITLELFIQKQHIRKIRKDTFLFSG